MSATVSKTVALDERLLGETIAGGAFW